MPGTATGSVRCLALADTLVPLKPVLHGGLRHRLGEVHPVGGWFYPRLIGWNGYLGISNGDVRFRNTFVYHSNFGEARLEIGTASMKARLERAKPGGIPFNPKDLWSW
ncbi:hypothetical protein [Streptosporangium roseum]|uniref:hypothetical protein n=1 Tax=Streptosporangium roseum TaxID=2001 RepID=UPI003321BE4C